jgi:N-acetyl-alpha-D-glucosaminyl L-malate synthase BshA
VKRVFDCIRILAEVRKEVDAKLYMVGDGPDRGPAERLARELGVDHHTIFMGKQNHVERLIPQAHVLLLPSEMESFGLAALEGMACGVPPVSTRVGGVPELVTSGVDGFLENVGDIESQSARAVELLSDDSLHERVAKAARKTATSRFCTDLIIPQYESYYRDVAS